MLLLDKRTHEESQAAQDSTFAVSHKSLRAQASVGRPRDQNRTLSGKVSIFNLSYPQWAVL